MDAPPAISKAGSAVARDRRAVPFEIGEMQAQPRWQPRLDRLQRSSRARLIPVALNPRALMTRPVD